MGSASFAIEQKQMNPVCAESEMTVLLEQQEPKYYIANPNIFQMPLQKTVTNPPKVAILREEGSNGDREMAAAFYLAGFDVFDINTYDLEQGHVQLSNFRDWHLWADSVLQMSFQRAWAGPLVFNKIPKYGNNFKNSICGQIHFH